MNLIKLICYCVASETAKHKLVLQKINSYAGLKVDGQCNMKLKAIEYSKKHQSNLSSHFQVDKIWKLI